MLGKLLRLFGIHTSSGIAAFEATKNDRIYATPKDYMSLVLKSNDIKAMVAMGFMDDGKTLNLYIQSTTQLDAEKMISLEMQLHERISNAAECRKPRYVFWTFSDLKKITA